MTFVMLKKNKINIEKILKHVFTSFTFLKREEKVFLYYLQIFIKGTFMQQSRLFYSHNGKSWKMFSLT